MDFKKTYTSRRTKNYDDNDSNGEDEKKSLQRKDTGVIEYKDTQGRITVLKPNPKFEPYKNIFKKLIKQTNVVTPSVIISMIINYTSTHAIAVLKKSEHQALVNMYSLKTYKQVFEEPVGKGLHHQCIKCHGVEQNNAGNKFALCYMDDGKFFLRIFGFE